MDTLNRYLNFVRSGLSGAGKEDIVAELSENLRSRIDEREEALGRPLTEAELEGLLGKFGHPLVVAGRYRANGGTLTFGRELIGPELFPFYTLALKWSLGITSTLVILIMSGLAIANPSRWPELFPALGIHLGLQFTIQTAVWILVQAHLTRFPGSWRAHERGDLPTPLRSEQQEVPRVSRFESVLQLVLTATIFPWVHGVLWPQHVPFGPGELGPVWHRMYAPFVLMTLLSVTQAMVNLFRPEWARPRTATTAVTALWVGMLVYVLRAGDWVILTDTTGDLATKQQQIAAINQYVFYYPLLGALLGAAVVLALQVWALVREYRTSPWKAADQN